MKRYRPFITLAFLAASLTAPAGAQMKPPIPMTAAQFSQAVAGAPVQLAVRLTSRERNVLRAVILDRRDDTHYRATNNAVELFFPVQTPVVMGSDADLQPGAVLFVNAIATTPGHADVKRATVITAYVKVD